jgi:heat shock protein HslJ
MICNRNRVAVAGVLVLALFASGCSILTGDSGDLPVVGDWELVTGTAGEEVVPLVPGYRITFSSDGSTFGGTAACNAYGGSINTEARALSFEELFVTEMACRPELMAAEQAYLSALQLVNATTRDGDVLLLSGDATELWFVAVAPVPQEALVGTPWILETLIDGETATSAMGDAVTLDIRQDGTLTAGTGCRTLTGTWIATGDEIATPELGAEGECTAQLERQDGHVVGVLEGGFTVDIDGDRLTLTAAGEQGLVYRAGQPASSPSTSGMSSPVRSWKMP